MQNTMLGQLDSRFKRTLDGISDSGLKHSTFEKTAKISAAYTKYLQEEQRLNNDGNLSATGKSEAIVRAAAKCQQEIEAIVAYDPYALDAAAILAGIPKDEFGDPVLLQAQGQEFRRHLATLPAGLAQAQYDAEILQGDTPMVIYLETSPIPYPFVTATTRATSRMARLAKSDPEKAKKLADLNAAQEAWTTYAKAATNMLAGY